MTGEGLRDSLSSVMPKRIHAVVVHYFAEDEGKIDTDRLGLVRRQLGAGLCLGVADFIEHGEVGEQLPGQEQIPPAAEPHVSGLLGFVAFWNFFIRDQTGSLPGRQPPVQFLLGRPGRREVGTGWGTEPPEKTDFFLAIGVGEFDRHLGANRVHLRRQPTRTAAGKLLDLLPIDHVPATRTDGITPFEGWRVPGVPALESGPWPVAILPLLSLDDAEGAIVALPGQRDFGEGGQRCFWLSLFVDDVKIGGKGNVELALGTGHLAKPEVSILDWIVAKSRFSFLNGCSLEFSFSVALNFWPQLLDILEGKKAF